MSEQPVLLLNRSEVIACLAGIDINDLISRTLVAHADKQTVLPAEGYLSWRTPTGAAARSLALYGGVPHAGDLRYGLKVINAAIDNPSRGLDRAGGLGLLFDTVTARPVAIIEVGRISAARTAAYTALSLSTMGPAVVDSVTLIGSGALARAHLTALASVLTLREVQLFDLATDRAEEFAAWITSNVAQVRPVVHQSVQSAVKSSTVVVTLTTADEGYLRYADFAPGTFIANVSLGDLRDDVFTGAESIVVDDLELVRENPRRPLGRLLSAPAPAVQITGTLGEMLAGRIPAVRPRDGIVVSNPFGMGVLDVALIGAVTDAARSLGIGTEVEFTS